MAQNCTRTHHLNSANWWNYPLNSPPYPKIRERRGWDIQQKKKKREKKKKKKKKKKRYTEREKESFYFKFYSFLLLECLFGGCFNLQSSIFNLQFGACKWATASIDRSCVTIWHRSRCSIAGSSTIDCLHRCIDCLHRFGCRSIQLSIPSECSSQIGQSAFPFAIHTQTDSLHLADAEDRLRLVREDRLLLKCVIMGLMKIITTCVQRFEQLAGCKVIFIERGFAPKVVIPSSKRRCWAS
jgi:hypothetical protein